MKKDELKRDDILIFKNNDKAVLGADNLYIINEFYDNELNCLKDDNYTVQKVYRPVYQLVYEREKEHTLQKDK